MQSIVVCAQIQPQHSMLTEYSGASSHIHLRATRCSLETSLDQWKHDYSVPLDRTSQCTFLSGTRAFQKTSGVLYTNDKTKLLPLTWSCVESRDMKETSTGEVRHLTLGKTTQAMGVVRTGRNATDGSIRSSNPSIISICRVFPAILIITSSGLN